MADDEIVLPIRVSTAEAEAALEDFKRRAVVPVQIGAGAGVGATAIGPQTAALEALQAKATGLAAAFDALTGRFAAFDQGLGEGAAAAKDAEKAVTDLGNSEEEAATRTIALGSALGSFLGGAAQSLVHAGLHLVFRLVRDAIKEANAETEAFEKSIDEVAKKAGDAVAAVRASAGALSLGFVTDGMSKVDAWLEARKADLAAQTAIAQAKLDALEYQGKGESDKAVELRTALAELQAALRTAETQAKALGIRETRSNQVKEERDLQKLVNEQAKVGLEERARIEEDGREKLEAIDAKRFASEQAREAARVAVRAATARQLAAIDEREAEQAVRDADESNAAWDRMLAEFRRHREQEEAAALREEEKALDAWMKQMDKRAETYLQFLAWQQTGFDTAHMKRLEAIHKEAQQELDLLAYGHSIGRISTEEYERLKTKVVQDEAAKREAILRKENLLEMELQRFALSALHQFASGIGQAFGGLVSHVAAYDRAQQAAGNSAKKFADDGGAAIAKFVQDQLAGIATMAATQAVYETAMALATQGLSWGVPNPASVNHWAAAAAFGAIAVGTGATAYGIGQFRGLTGDEKASAYGSGPGTGASSTASSPSSDAGGARAAGAVANQSGVVQREVVIVVGDPFETPQEAARRAARRLGLANQLDMTRRVG